MVSYLHVYDYKSIDSVDSLWYANNKNLFTIKNMTDEVNTGLEVA